jgi:hypothetical protein
LLTFQPAAASAPTEPLTSLRWARGTVVAVGPEAVTLKLRDDHLVVTRAAATEIIGERDALAPGSIIETHYTDRRGVRTAVVIITGRATGDGGISKRPGMSVLGGYVSAKRGAVSMRSNKRTRSFQVENRSRLIDREGQELAKGFKPVAGLIASGQRLLVKYQGVDTTIGELSMSSDNAIEIRQMGG